MGKRVLTAIKNLFPDGSSTPLEGAFLKLSTPCLLLEHEMAGIVIDNFDVRKLGEELAFEALIQIVCFVPFPSFIKEDYLGRAKGFLEELLALGGYHELHDAEVEKMNAMIEEGATLQDVISSYKAKKIPA